MSDKCPYCGTFPCEHCPNCGEFVKVMSSATGPWWCKECIQQRVVAAVAEIRKTENHPPLT